ncbi:MAG: carboxylesterase family protein [Oscillospiraceae bacterium]|nr:carboxylesterase family protein [Oscillospiraceae bacterium]
MKKRVLAAALCVVMAVGLTAPAMAKSYTVKAGDNLSKIAAAELGSADKWKEIYEANKAQIKDANKIYVGQVLEIPGEEKPAEDTRVATGAVFTNTTGGMVCGYSVDGIDQYYGIPYGTAERFMAAKPASWNGAKVCWAYGEVCPQWGEVAEQDPFNFMNNQKLMIENEAKCLNLNVLTKGVSEDGSLKPVFVWFHGGGWSTGSSMQQDIYDGINLVDRGDIVFVSINHRLNALGFLDLTAYGEKYKDSANVGVLDMVLALEWVRDNAAAFGGDPNNVTIAGQSGGGAKVTTLMGMPAAQGLFHKAIAMSGGAPTVTRTHADAQAETEKVLAELGITAENIADIETIDYDDLYAAYKTAGYRDGPVLDDAITGALELSKDIPLMCGNVLGEFSTNCGDLIYGTPNLPTAMAEFIFNAEFIPANWDEAKTMEKLTKKYGDKAEEIKAAFEAAYPGHPVGEVLYMNNRTIMDSNRIAEGFEAVGGTCYQYVQAWSYPMFGGVVPIHTAGDVPLWFYNLNLIRHFIAGYEDVAAQIADKMSGAIISMCYQGTPGWAEWNSETDAVMVFDEVSQVRYHHEDTLLPLLQGEKTVLPF